MVNKIYRSKNTEEKVRHDTRRIASLEIRSRLANNLTSAENTSFQFQATQFVQCNTTPEVRINPLTAPATIDEATNTAVKAYTNFDDAFGSGTATSNPLAVGSDRIAIPLADIKGKTAFYHGYYRPDINRKNLEWPYMKPTITHTKQYLLGRAVGLNTLNLGSGFSRDTFVYYSSHADFNISASISVAIWFYPTTLGILDSEPYRFLLWRYIDASNYYAIVIRNSDNKLLVFTNEAAALTKQEHGTALTTGAWHLVIITYNPTTNALVTTLNDNSTTSTPADTLTIPYTTNTNLYLGNIPAQNTKRVQGYLKAFVFWSGKILTATEKTNFYNYGTIVSV